MAFLDINSIKKGHFLPIIQILYGVLAVLFLSIYFINQSFHEKEQMLDKRIMILNQQSTIVKGITLDNFSETSSQALFMIASLKVLDEGNDIKLTVANINNLTPETDETSNQILRDIQTKWDYFVIAHKGYHFLEQRNYIKTLDIQRVLNEVSRLQDNYYSVLKKRQNALQIARNTWVTVLFIVLVVLFVLLYFCTDF